LIGMNCKLTLSTRLHKYACESSQQNSNEQSFGYLIA